MGANCSSPGESSDSPALKSGLPQAAQEKAPWEQEAWVPNVETKLYEEYINMLKDQAICFEGFGQSVTSADTLLVVDMQNDFLPKEVAPAGGAFGVAEGGSAVGPIVNLIQVFSRAGAQVVATRTFHPLQHASFNTCGGPFPPHCVQGSTGANFFPAIGKALKESGATVAFKGFAEEVDSFGAFQYDEDYYGERVKHCQWQISKSESQGVSCAGPWTGAFCLASSGRKDDINAPPDAMAVLRKDLRPLESVIPKNGRLVIVGLAWDYCVIDSAVNAAKLGYDVYLPAEAGRAAHVPGVGKYGSGFLTDAGLLASKMNNHNLKLIHVSDVH